jgi:hypothetical protein
MRARRRALSRQVRGEGKVSAAFYRQAQLRPPRRTDQGVLQERDTVATMPLNPLAVQVPWAKVFGNK